MEHRIDLGRLGPEGPRMAAAVQACVHCGFCLASCPTYQVLGEEMDSPRGRIYLMKGVLEGEIPLDGAAAEHIDRCLGCLACASACPSGVHYGELLTGFRSHMDGQRRRRPLSRTLRWALLQTLPHPRRFRVAAAAGVLARRLPGLMPRALRPMVELLPPSLPAGQPLPGVYPAQGTRRARVALLIGCVQQVISPSINEAALRVLSRNGVEVVIPQGQGCCGALAFHTGMAEQGRQLARRNLAAFSPADVDAVVSTAAGCGSVMKEYPFLFAGRPEEAQARAFATRVRDISEFLDELGVQPPPALPQPMRVAYHDACHLAHAQGIRSAPRRLLGAIPSLELVEIPEGEICCGSAGTYNLEQPELARELQQRKVENILSTGAQAVVAGNIGCMVQIETGLRSRGAAVRVYHTVELLDLAYRSGVSSEASSEALSEAPPATSSSTPVRARPA